MSRTSYTQAAGRVVREPVVEATPALKIELLTRLALKGGAASLRLLFDRRDPAWLWAGPTWATLTALALLNGGALTADPDHPEELIITEAGWVRVGRRHIPGVSP